MNYRIRDWPVRERPRERLYAAGAQALSTRELLAILVGSGNEGNSAVEVGGKLLQTGDGSLRRLSAMSSCHAAKPRTAFRGRLPCAPDGDAKASGLSRHPPGAEGSSR